MNFTLKGKVVVITGGAGFLGIKHAEAIAEIGGLSVIADINGDKASRKAKEVSAKYGILVIGCKVDITILRDIERMTAMLISRFGKIDVLINNATNNPKMDYSFVSNPSRLENFSLKQWENDIAVGLTGAFLCSRVIGAHMAKRKSGVIINIASDLGVIAPDQRIYRKKGVREENQPVKPVTYSVVKHGIIGLTRYLATYWCDDGVRVNALCPGGVYDGQAADFVKKLVYRIPLGRMAKPDEYKGAIQFLASDASSYMTGNCIVMDGGRSTW